MFINDIARFLEELYPPSLQEDYDNCGLITGNAGDHVKGVLLTLDVTPEVLDEAVVNECNLIIAHHPLIFKGIRKLTGNDPVQQMVIKAIKNDIAIYAVHTNIDNSFHGLNLYLAEKLSLQECRILAPREGILFKLVTFCPEDHAETVRQAMFAAGAGHIGNYDQCSYNLSGEGTFRAGPGTDPFVGEVDKIHFEKETRIEVILPGYLKKKVVDALITIHPYEEVAYDLYPLSNEFKNAGSGIIGVLREETGEEEFLLNVKDITGIPVIRHSSFRKKKIRKAAICTGSGSFVIHRAFVEGADILLTADLKYHDFFEYQGRMILADIGHYESEYHVKELLNEVLTKKFPNFAFLVSKTVTNPVNYF